MMKAHGLAMDGTINTETKMPSQDFQTIKSLAVSPSTASNTSREYR